MTKNLEKRREHEKHRVKHRDLDVQFDQSSEAINGFSEVDGLGVEIDFFDFCIGTHHEVLAPERNREHKHRGSGGDFECGVYGALTEHPGSAKRFECGVHGALTAFRGGQVGVRAQIQQKHQRLMLVFLSGIL